jgi:hypothetical protein
MYLATVLSFGVCDAMDTLLFGGNTVYEDNPIILSGPSLQTDNINQLGIETTEISIGYPNKAKQKKEEGNFRAIYFTEDTEKGLVELQKKILGTLESNGYTIRYVGGCEQNGLYEKTIDVQGNTIDVGISTRINSNKIETKKFHCSLDALKDLKNISECDKRETEIKKEWGESSLNKGIMLKEVRPFNTFVGVELCKGEKIEHSKLFDELLSKQKSHVSLFKIKTPDESTQDKLKNFLGDIDDLASSREMILSKRDTKLPPCFVEIYNNITAPYLPTNHIDYINYNKNDLEQNKKLTDEQKKNLEQEQKKLLEKLIFVSRKNYDCRKRVYHAIFMGIISQLFNTKRLDFKPTTIPYASINNQLNQISLVPLNL